MEFIETRHAAHNKMKKIDFISFLFFTIFAPCFAKVFYFENFIILHNNSSFFQKISLNLKNTHIIIMILFKSIFFNIFLLFLK